MARNSYQSQLDDLRGQVTAMAETTLERYDMAAEVLETGDQQRAMQVIEGDEDINDWYLDIESDCIQLLALQQPVAGDLRFIASSFKIITDLERIGDLATNLARYGSEADGTLLETTDVLPLVDQSRALVSDAMDAYARDDAGAARNIAATDDELDLASRQTSERLVRELLTSTQPADDQLDTTLEDISRALLTIRDLERIGDHGVNICARTLYMVENDDELIY